MTEHRASAIPFRVPPVPDSDKNPYNRVTCIEGLVNAAIHLYAHTGIYTSPQNVGLSELLDVIKEKTDALGHVLCHPAFDECWGETCDRISREKHPR